MPAPRDLPDRGHLTTEQRLTEAAAIDALSIENALRLINTQDMRVPQVVRTAIPTISRLVKQAVERMRIGGRLVYVGTGTSGRLGVLDASECPPTFQSNPDQVIGIIAGGDTALRKSSEAREDEAAGPVTEFNQHAICTQDTVVGITAGGTTPYVWGALKLARERDCLTALITCVPVEELRRWRRPRLLPANASLDAAMPATRSELPCPVDHIIELPVGPEVVTGSTRMLAGTATKLALNMISTVAMIQLGKTWGNLMVDLRATNDKLVDRAVRMLQAQCQLDRGQALDLLNKADSHVKTAIVMAKRDVDAQTARQLLESVQGQLRKLVGGPK